MQEWYLNSMRGFEGAPRKAYHREIMALTRLLQLAPVFQTGRFKSGSDTWGYNIPTALARNMFGSPPSIMMDLRSGPV